ncbi:hypothetical protein DY245_22395 [Streptomyces inhibens]|uniref:Uncharacterized protein n=1 Tax=Streptomyces inhibens TaxID=2293571 RepID=A0A371Q1N8_STRIH|nr:hypothetical protein [Streptomyces inhibens]REK88253.1 hypothetical protein DY245_22395 [Streptomyces inhibens]
MEAEVSAGWIGLIGASVGAAGALLGGWLQHRQQKDTARQERWEGYARAAGEATLTELLAAQEEMTAWWSSFTGLDDEANDLYGIILERGRTAKHCSLLIPEAIELRARLKTVLAVMTDYKCAPPGDEPEALIHFKWSYRATQEGIESIATFLRGEPLPPATMNFKMLEAQRTAYRAENPLPGP